MVDSFWKNDVPVGSAVREYLEHRRGIICPICARCQGACFLGCESAMSEAGSCLHTGARDRVQEKEESG